jgi:3-mercaptopyruvate sulfurtransferase SseA
VKRNPNCPRECSERYQFIEAKSLSVAFHKLQVNQELKDYQIAGLESALKVRKKQKKKSTIMDLRQRDEYHGSAVFYSPRKIREAQFRELTKQQEDEQERLEKQRERRTELQLQDIESR